MSVLRAGQLWRGLLPAAVESRHRERGDGGSRPALVAFFLIDCLRAHPGLTRQRSLRRR
jgi:hypothetical protein